MIVLDAYALVALLANEPAGKILAPRLEPGEVAISAANLAESLDVLNRIHGVPVPRASTLIGALVNDAIRLIPLDGKLAYRAAELRGRHYARRGAQLSLADCAVVASAPPGSTIATADRPLATMARAEGFGVLALPDSAGVTP